MPMAVARSSSAAASRARGPVPSNAFRVAMAEGRKGEAETESVGWNRSPRSILAAELDDLATAIGRPTLKRRGLVEVEASES